MTKILLVTALIFSAINPAIAEEKWPGNTDSFVLRMYQDIWQFTPVETGSLGIESFYGKATQVNESLLCADCFKCPCT